MSVYDLDWAEGRAEANDLYPGMDWPDPPEGDDGESEVTTRLDSGFARDLQYADVADARSGSDRTEALTRPDSLTDSLAPFGVGSGTARRSAPHAGQGSHLAGCFDDFAKSLDGLGAARVVERDGDAEGFGLGAEAVVRLRFTDELCVGHSGNLAYRRGGVKS